MKILVDVNELIAMLHMYPDMSIYKIIDMITKYPADTITSVSMVDDMMLDHYPEYKDFIDKQMNSQAMEEICRYIPKAKIDPSLQNLYMCQTGFRKTFLMIDNNNVGLYKVTLNPEVKK